MHGRTVPFAHYQEAFTKYLAERLIQKDKDLAEAVGLLELYQDTDGPAVFMDNGDKAKAFLKKLNNGGGEG